MKYLKYIWANIQTVFYSISLITLFLGLIEIFFYIIDVNIPSKVSGSTKPFLNKGIYVIFISYFIFSFAYFFLKDKGKKIKERYLICISCKKTFDKLELKTNNICPNCNNKLEGIDEYYEKEKLS